MVPGRSIIALGKYLRHRKKEIDDAIKAQIDRISHSTMLGLSNVPAIQLAEKLVTILQRELDTGTRQAEKSCKIRPSTRPGP